MTDVNRSEAEQQEELGLEGQQKGKARMFGRTDLGNAERFIAQHGADVRYMPAWKSWLVWDGKRWKVDETLEIMRLAKRTIRSMYPAARKLSRASARELLVQHAMKSESEGKIKAMLSLAAAECAITPDALDTDPWLLACENGTIDLRTGALLKHDRAHLITKLAPARYDVDAECPRWLEFLDTVAGGDQALINFLQRAIGYSLTGVTAERVFFVLYGTGRNGKSKFLELLRALLAGYSAHADSSTWLERKSEGPRTDVARLFGARLVTSSEVGEGKRLNEQLVKQLVGDETVTARFLFSREFEFRPAFKVWIAANHRPVVRGTDRGIWDRIRLVPFTVRIPDEKVDDKILEKLTAELPGILAWAVGGCVLWQRDGLAAPAAVVEATEEYRAESDVLGAFLEECCELGSDFDAPSSLLYEAYVRWCSRGGERHVLTLTAFGAALTERKIPVTKRHGSKIRLGIRLAGELGMSSRATRHADSSAGDRVNARETDEDASPPAPGLEL